jgi:hypothetical protein
MTWSTSPGRSLPLGYPSADDDINRACVTIDGGRWLPGATVFSAFSRLSEGEWQEMRTRRGS